MFLEALEAEGREREADAQRDTGCKLRDAHSIHGFSLVAACMSPLRALPTWNGPAQAPMAAGRPRLPANRA